MRLTRRALALCCALALLAALFVPANAEGLYFGSHPADDIYLTQSVAHTCTLIAATMMLRNYSAQRGSPYQMVTDTGVGHYAWTKQWGLSQNFTIGQVQVTCNADIRNCIDKKAYLINVLQYHPEGVVIYDTGAPHAIWLFGYDEDSDTFYCADTINRNGGHAIPLVESIIRGETQQDKVNTIDKIWYVL
ncbi:MAG: hypothetical protein IJ769_03085 [Clostridia bacterium]|nr:hypothetical protein [Clostridia bacterium]